MRRPSFSNVAVQHVYEVEDGSRFDWVSGVLLLLFVGASLGFTLFVGKELCGQILAIDPMLLGGLGG